MTAPAVVAGWPELAWVEIDDAVWLAGDILKLPLGPIGHQAMSTLVAHNDPATGKQCRHSPAAITRHTVVAQDPLTLSPSLACGACAWHGFVTVGHWVPA